MEAFGNQRLNVDHHGLSRDRCHPLRMATLLKFLLTLVLSALFAVLLLPYCWVGVWVIRLVAMLLDDLFSHFGSTTPGWVEMAIGVPVAIGWLATFIALFVFALIGIWRRPKKTSLTEGKG